MPNQDWLGPLLGALSGGFTGIAQNRRYKDERDDIATERRRRGSFDTLAQQKDLIEMGGSVLPEQLDREGQNIWSKLQAAGDAGTIGTGNLRNTQPYRTFDLPDPVSGNSRTVMVNPNESATSIAMRNAMTKMGRENELGTQRALAVKNLELNAPPKTLMPGQAPYNPKTGKYDPPPVPVVDRNPVIGSEGWKAAERFKASLQPKPTANPGFTQADKLRDEVNTQLKDHVQIANAYRKVVAGASGGTPQSDMSLIFGFMRMQDPGSTVREGEYATAQNAGSWTDAMRNAYNRAVDGQKLQPGQREGFVKAANSILQSQRPSVRQINQRYESLARNYGLDPRTVLYDPYEEFGNGSGGGRPAGFRGPAGGAP